MLTGSEAALVSSAGIEQLTYLYPRVLGIGFYVFGRF